MANSGINVLLSLKDMFTDKMKGVQKSTNQQRLEIKKLNMEMKKLKSSMISGTASFVKGGLGLMGISTALSSISDVASQAMSNYALQSKAESQVFTALNKSMAGADVSSINAMNDSYKDLASTLQSVGVIGDEVTLTGMAQMTNLGMNPEDVKNMIPYVQDLAVKINGVDVNAENFKDTSTKVANAINKGSLKAFANMGVQVTELEQKQFKAMNTTERTAFLQNKLAQAVGGTNKAMSNTPAGKQAQAMNSYGDALEAIGKPLSQLKGTIQGALIAPMNWLAEKVPIAVEWVTALASTIGGYFAPVLESLGISESAKEWQFWGDILGAVFNEVGFIIGVVAKVIAGAIAGIMFVIVQLGKIVSAICSGIATAWSGMVDIVSGVLSYWIDHITNVFMSLWKIVDGLLKVTIGVIVGLFTGDFSTAVEGAGSVFEGVMGLMESAWNNTFGLIISGIEVLGNKLSAFKNNLMGAGSDYNKAVENANQGNYAHGTLGFATGTSYFKGGFTHINEQNRGELVNLPNGTQIIPHDLSKQMLQGNRTVQINVNISGNVIGNDDFYNECGNAIYNKLVNAMGNI